MTVVSYNNNNLGRRATVQNPWLPLFPERNEFILGQHAFCFWKSCPSICCLYDVKLNSINSTIESGDWHCIVSLPISLLPLLHGRTADVQGHSELLGGTQLYAAASTRRRKQVNNVDTQTVQSTASVHFTSTPIDCSAQNERTTDTPEMSSKSARLAVIAVTSLLSIPSTKLNRSCTQL